MLIIIIIIIILKNTFDPKVIFQHIGKSLSSLVSDKRVAIKGDAPKTMHSIQVWSAISQTVLPRFVMSQHCLMLKPAQTSRFDIFLKYNQPR